MHRPLASCLAALVATACTAATPRVQTGEDAEKSPDGLHKVDGVAVGTLYMRPDYFFGSYESFFLKPTSVDYARGARMLELEEEDELIRIFETVARQAIGGSGRKEVYDPGPCVAVVQLALVDIDVGAEAGAVGATTLVMEVRDGVTNEALLRYGQRRRLMGTDLETAFRRYSLRFQQDFNRSLPVEVSPGIVSCQERAGEGAPPAGP